MMHVIGGVRVNALLRQFRACGSMLHLLHDKPGHFAAEWKWNLQSCSCLYNAIVFSVCWGDFRPVSIVYLKPVKIFHVFF